MLRKEASKPTPRKTPPSTSGTPSNTGKFTADTLALTEEDQKLFESPLAWVYLTSEQATELIEGDIDACVNRLNSIINLTEYREDMREQTFNAIQTSTFFGIMKVLFDKLNVMSASRSLRLFKRLLLNHTSTLSKSLSFFQHYKLYQYTSRFVQEEEKFSIISSLEFPPLTSPLSEATTLMQYEEEQERLREIERREQEERERQEAEIAAAANPFEVLSADDIRALATDIVASLMKATATDFDRLMEDQKCKLAAQIAKMSIIS
ncbi:hypothetical protein BC829DRAFT_392534 [Chytridium lagenaria]|nr:hypothetical protein BC829DRAFT_392534 [Chytridium lagenaria]